MNTINVTTLANGLKFATCRMPSVKSAAINLLVKVGSRYEEIGESGISHFLEHMAFKGTKNRSSLEIAKEFDAIGGNFNAYTSRESTVYHAKVLGNKMEIALEIIADIMQNSLFNKSDIEKEYGVIMQEIASVQDAPDDIVFEKLYDIAYLNQPMGRSILGTKDTISKFDAHSFRNYLAKHYSAGNMVLSIAGCVDHDKILPYIEKLFSALPNHEEREVSSAKYFGGFSVIQKDLEQSFVALGFSSVSYKKTFDFYTSQIVSLLLGGGYSSRLFQSVREDLGLAYMVGSANSSYSDTGLFAIYAGTDHQNIEILLKTIKQEVAKLINDVSDQELLRAKNQVQASIFMAEEKSSYKSDDLARQIALFDHYSSPEEIIATIDSIKKEDVSKSLSEIISSSPSLVIASRRGQENFDNNFWQNL